MIRRTAKTIFPALLIASLLFSSLFLSVSCGKTYYTAADFGIETVKSPADANQNGLDDYTDLLLGARADARAKPVYDDSYFEDGYPPDNIGVCADVIWRAFRAAGYCLRDMIDADIAADLNSYSSITVPDSNIDFRRVVNLKVFFSKYAVKLTTDITAIAEWQPGDIVIFRNNDHIGIVSDRRNASGQAYVIHNGGQDEREEDYLSRDTVTAHYRFDASKVPDSVVVFWED